ncbi:MAG: 16S rRNA (cytosine(1402)-N(4))-methyltransferase RsmH [Rhodospirillales bacterium]|nr:16S rRNA (cytosine(1402)-N(4))-methyltransferase RsmH [Rhodospirillales bacterium]
MNTPAHIPVLLNEVLTALAPRAGGRYLDGTFGHGGYSRALLAACDCAVLGIDRDPQAVAVGHQLEQESAGRFTMLAGRFGDMERLLPASAKLDGMTLDLGLSSPQIDQAERGFSFRFDGPLDMRMGSATEGSPSAADLVNGLPEGALAGIIYRYGEERFARRVARAIVAARQEAAITRTGELADLVRANVHRAKDGIDPATRTFQALRIAVNDELGEIEHGLAAAERLLALGGRLAVVSFHSLEDRAVKRFLAQRSRQGQGGSRHLPSAALDHAPSFRLLFRKPQVPGAEEIRINPRAGSARLRAAERTDAEAWQEGRQ